jgi:hypothetical protein
MRPPKSRIALLAVGRGCVAATMTAVVGGKHARQGAQEREDNLPLSRSRPLSLTNAFSPLVSHLFLSLPQPFCLALGDTAARVHARRVAGVAEGDRCKGARMPTVTITLQAT